jgi:hypothetical protein
VAVISTALLLIHLPSTIGMGHTGQSNRQTTIVPALSLPPLCIMYRPSISPYKCLLSPLGIEVLSGGRISKHSCSRWVVNLSNLTRWLSLYVAARCIGDIATPAERGGFFGFSSIGSLLGTVIGPVIGGM